MKLGKKIISALLLAAMALSMLTACGGGGGGGSSDSSASVDSSKIYLSDTPLATGSAALSFPQGEMWFTVEGKEFDLREIASDGTNIYLKFVSNGNASIGYTLLETSNKIYLLDNVSSTYNDVSNAENYAVMVKMAKSVLNIKDKISSAKKNTDWDDYDIESIQTDSGVVSYMFYSGRSKFFSSLAGTLYHVSIADTGLSGSVVGISSADIKVSGPSNDKLVLNNKEYTKASA